GKPAAERDGRSGRMRPGLLAPARLPDGRAGRAAAAERSFDRLTGARFCDVGFGGFGRAVRVGSRAAAWWWTFDGWRTSHCTEYGMAARRPGHGADRGFGDAADRSGPASAEFVESGERPARNGARACADREVLAGQAEVRKARGAGRILCGVGATPGVDTRS